MRRRGRGVLTALGLAVTVLSVAGVARGEPPGGHSLRFAEDEMLNLVAFLRSSAK